MKGRNTGQPFFQCHSCSSVVQSWHQVELRKHSCAQDSFFFIALFWFIFTDCYLYFPSLSKKPCPNSVFKCWLLRELREDLNHAVLCLIPSLKSKCTSTVWYCALCFSHLGGLERGSLNVFCLQFTTSVERTWHKNGRNIHKHSHQNIGNVVYGWLFIHQKKKKGFNLWIHCSPLWLYIIQPKKKITTCLWKYAHSLFSVSESYHEHVNFR